MKKQTYDSALKELQEIVEALQQGSIGIDELSGKVKRAAELIRFCRTKLRQTESDVSHLLDQE